MPNRLAAAERGRRAPNAGLRYERLVDVCEELVRFTWLVRDNGAELVDRYSERMEEAGKEAAAVAALPKHARGSGDVA